MLFWCKTDITVLKSLWLARYAPPGTDITMLHRLLRLVATAICAVMILGLCITTAEARRARPSCHRRSSRRTGLDQGQAEDPLEGGSAATEYQMRVPPARPRAQRAKPMRTQPTHAAPTPGAATATASTTCRSRHERKAPSALGRAFAAFRFVRHACGDRPDPSDQEPRQRRDRLRDERLAGHVVHQRRP